MKLKADELRMLQGKEGHAKQKAMELLVRYGEILGAEQFVEVTKAHVAILFFSSMETLYRKKLCDTHDTDQVFSEFYLDSREKVKIGRFACETVTDVASCDAENIMGVEGTRVKQNQKMVQQAINSGIHFAGTCTPYQVGFIPLKGEHCTTTESHAVIYLNSVFGACTNADGLEAAFSTALTGKTPLWGCHVDANRRGTCLVEIEIKLENNTDWDLLGYYVGERVPSLGVPVFKGVTTVPRREMLTSCFASLATSGGVEMCHIVGLTPEARTLQDAFGNNKPEVTIRFGAEQRKEAYQVLNTARDEDVDLIILGCPHYSISQIEQVCSLLRGKTIHENTTLWIYTAAPIKTMADKSGYTDVITKAGAYLLTGSCPLVAECWPKGTKIIATDSGKQAYYTGSATGIGVWYGSMSDCVNAAITGKWRGELN